MTDREQKKARTVLAVLVALLTTAVVVQSFFLYRLYRSSEREEPAPQPSVSITRKAPAGTLQKAGTAGSSRPQRSFPPGTPAPYDVDTGAWFGWGLDDWDPFAEMQQMRQRMDRLFEDSFNRFRISPGFTDRWADLSFAPELDLTDDGDNYIVRFNIPGAEKSNISVNIDDRVLTISGRTDERIEEKEGDEILRLERRSGQFRRSTTLPGPVDGVNMKAEYKDGVLTVTVPRKKTEKQAKTIKVQ